jgi:hypothetical protein
MLLHQYISKYVDAGFPDKAILQVIAYTNRKADFLVGRGSAHELPIGLPLMRLPAVTYLQ